MVLAGIAELEDGLNIKHDPTECSKNRVHMMDAAFLVQTRPTSDHTRRRHAVHASACVEKGSGGFCWQKQRAERTVNNQHPNTCVV